jgi:hypothetical protein
VKKLANTSEKDLKQIPQINIVVAFQRACKFQGQAASNQSHVFAATTALKHFKLPNECQKFIKMQKSSIFQNDLLLKFFIDEL